MKKLAKRKSLIQGELNNSITRGAGSLSGYLGEMIVVSVLGGSHSNTFDYDVVLEDGTTIDVKTKRCSSPPKVYYSCSVAKLSAKQDCDMYAFTRIKNDMSVGWYLGRISKNDFFLKATEHKKGEYDSDNGFTFRANCFNLPIRMLH